MLRQISVLASILLTIFVIQGCKPAGSTRETKSNNEKELPADLADKYREDATRLAIREYIASPQTGQQSADLDKERVDYFYKLLAKIYWMGQQNPNVPDLSYIHTLGNPNLKRVLVILEKNSPFKENWSHGNMMTGSLYLNQLVSKYELSVKDYRDGALGPTMILESKDYVNTAELAFLLANIDGIRHAEAEGIPGDGNDITWGQDSKEAMALKFSVGAGDCPSGCIYRKTWIFYVSPEGAIEYMGTRGQLPDGMDDRGEQSGK